MIFLQLLVNIYWWLDENATAKVYEFSQGMQRQNPLKSPSKSSDFDPPSLDAAFAKPGDQELFYTASVHFLKKRLQEKTHSKSQKETSQSCCNLTSTTNKETSLNSARPGVSKTEFSFEPPKQEPSSLPMHQVLPFPKSNKDTFLTRVRNTFRKYRQSVDMNDASGSEESEAKCISNFKFPRCERLSKGLHSSCLVEISEEKSVESISASSTKIVNADGRSDVLEEKKNNRTVR